MSEVVEIRAWEQLEPWYGLLNRGFDAKINPASDRSDFFRNVMLALQTGVVLASEHGFMVVMDNSRPFSSIKTCRCIIYSEKPWESKKLVAACREWMERTGVKSLFVDWPVSLKVAQRWGRTLGTKLHSLTFTRVIPLDEPSRLERC